MTQSDIAWPIGLLILLTFLQSLVPSIMRWSSSKYEDGTPATSKDGMGPRDEMPVPTVMVARAERAKHNLFEGLLMLFPALALSLMSGPTQITLAGVWVFLAARMFYIPCYLFAVLYVRSAFWSLSLIGIGLIWWSAI